MRYVRFIAFILIFVLHSDVRDIHLQQSTVGDIKCPWMRHVFPYSAHISLVIIVITIYTCTCVYIAENKLGYTMYMCTKLFKSSNVLRLNGYIQKLEFQLPRYLETGKVCNQKLASCTHSSVKKLHSGFTVSLSHG